MPATVLEYYMQIDGVQNTLIITPFGQLDIADLDAHTGSCLNLVPPSTENPLNPLTDASPTEHDNYTDDESHQSHEQHGVRLE